jgi:hypothetical protein
MRQSILEENSKLITKTVVELMGLDRQDEFVIPPRKNVRLCHFSGIDASDSET